MSDEFLLKWQKEVEAANLTADKFAELFADFIAHYYPNVTVKSIPPFSLELSPTAVPEEDARRAICNLENLWNSCSQSAGRRVSILKPIIDGLPDMINALSASNVVPEATLTNIVPLIRSVQFLNDLRATGFQAVWKDYAEDLVIVYGIDLPQAAIMLSLEQRLSLNLSDKELFDTTLANVKRILTGHVGLRPVGAGVFQVIATNSYESSLLLSENVMNGIASRVEGPLVVSVPAKNYVFGTGANSQEGMESLRELTRTVTAAGAYVISDKLYTCDGPIDGLMQLTLRA
jgi:uncharacterized protein YtpQ (UPF0354 family)